MGHAAEHRDANGVDNGQATAANIFAEGLSQRDQGDANAGGTERAEQAGASDQGHGIQVADDQQEDGIGGQQQQDARGDHDRSAAIAIGQVATEQGKDDAADPVGDRGAERGHVAHM